MTVTNIPSPVPIAFCITELDRGGAERALTQLVLGLDRQAWLPCVYCLSPRGYFAEPLEAGGITVECLNGRGLWDLPRVLFRLRRSLRQFRPAILQTFLFHGNIVGRIAGRMAGVPRIISGIRVAERRSRWFGRLDRWTNRLVDHNVCVSQGVAEFAIHETGLAASKVSVIPNGVDVAQFAHADPVDLTTLGLRAKDPVVITVGRLEEQKGIAALLHAAADVLRERSNCQFLIVGDGRDRSSLEALAQRLGITSAVHFAGPQSNVAGLLKSSTMFVLPSLWEGMSNALLEAMAARLPVIATSVEGSRDVIQSGTNGLLIPPGNPDALANAILMLLGDPATAERFASAAQLTVSQSFTTESMAAAYSNLYCRFMLPG